MLISDPIPMDKAAHFGVSYALTHSCQVITKKVFNSSKLKSTLLCAGATLAVGALKEVADAQKGATDMKNDFLADAAGVGFAITIITIDW
jgi:hypothetical protein